MLYFTIGLFVIIAVGVVAASFIVPLASDVVINAVDDVSDSHELRGVAGGEANNGVVEEPELILFGQC